MIFKGWKFYSSSTRQCEATTVREQRGCNNLAKWEKNGVWLCPAHARQRAKTEPAA